MLVPEIGVVEAGAAPGRHRRFLPGRRMGSGLGADLHRLQGVAQLLLQHPAAVGGGEGGGQLGGAGIALGGELQGNLEGEGGLGHLIELGRIGGGIHRVEGRQLQGCQVAPQGPVGQQDRFPQDRHRMVGGQFHHPAVGGPVGAGISRSPRLSIAGIAGRDRGTSGQAPSPQLLAQPHQRLQQRQVVLQPLEGGGHGAGLGLALRQGREGGEIHPGGRADGAAAEAVVLQLPLGREVQRHRQGHLTAAGLECRRLGQGRGEQRKPGAAHAEGLAPLPQPQVEGGPHGQPFRHAGGVHPEAPAAVLPARLEGQGRQAGAWELQPSSRRATWAVRSSRSLGAGVFRLARGGAAGSRRPCLVSSRSRSASSPPWIESRRSTCPWGGTGPRDSGRP